MSTEDGVAKTARTSASHFVNQFELRQLYHVAVTEGYPRYARGTWWRLGAKPAHLWCPSCRRTYPNGLFRLRGDARTCPYHDCQSAESRARAWSDVRSREQQDDLPRQPLHGVIYPSSLALS